MNPQLDLIQVAGATEHNLKDISVTIPRGKFTVVTGVSGSGKSSLAFDTILAESQRRFFYTLSHYSRQFLDLGTRPAVRKITGLSPAIALAQNETAPSRRATLGSLTDISELLAVMFARFGEPHCPKHGAPTAKLTRDEIVSHILEAADGQNIALLVPLAKEKKGVFRQQLTQFLQKGYTKAWIDGKLHNLDPLPELAREEKHTIKIVIDVLKVKHDAPDRLIRAVQTVLELGQDYGEWLPLDAKGHWHIDDCQSFSTAGGCPECGFSWPKLDSRYFNANSLGRCENCDGYGTRAYAEEYEPAEEDHDGVSFIEEKCETCAGTGINAESRAVKLGSKPIHDYVLMPLKVLTNELQLLSKSPALRTNPAFARVFDEVKAGVDRLVDMKLGYLSLSRRVRSLSGGEAQRVKLAGILSENLRGILYVLDEPSQGLHPTELADLIKNLRALRDQGNTIIVVDHDEDVIRSADHIVDLGPGGGLNGGYVQALFTPKTAKDFAKISQTAAWLARSDEKKKTKKTQLDKSTAFVDVKGARLHNLQNIDVQFPLEKLTVVTGVSGAGKSSLVLGVLLPNLLDIMDGKGPGKKTTWQHCTHFKGGESLTSVSLIDRKPVAKSSVSMPATYLDVLGDLRDLYASLPDAQVAGLTAKSFSLHLEGGRCPECKGKGEVNLSMRFLADARIQCPVCLGKRFRSHVLDVKFNGLNMSDVLNLTIAEAVKQFAHHRKITQKLAPALRLGLDYLKLGQPSASLSGGEAQRLKMVPYFSKKLGPGSFLILDEPTTGLHFTDVERLVAVMRELVALGATLVVVEHNDDVIAAADWQVEVGPGSADEGGHIVYQGLPKC